jgi:hypothetical protein
VQRRALAVLFFVLAAALASVGIFALAGTGSAERIVVGVAALAIAVWLGSLSLSALRH